MNTRTQIQQTVNSKQCGELSTYTHTRTRSQPNTHTKHTNSLRRKWHEEFSNLHFRIHRLSVYPNYYLYVVFSFPVSTCYKYYKRERENKTGISRLEFPFECIFPLQVRSHISFVIHTWCRNNLRCDLWMVSNVWSLIFHTTHLQHIDHQHGNPNWIDVLANRKEKHFGRSQRICSSIRSVCFIDVRFAAARHCENNHIYSHVVRTCFSSMPIVVYSEDDDEREKNRIECYSYAFKVNYMLSLCRTN